jgi:hypothetical protein
VKNFPKRRSAGFNRFLVLSFSLILTSLLCACSTGLKVRSEIDPATDFSRYTTYNFFEPMGIEGGYNSPIFGEHFRAAIGGELARRRYQTSDNPDLLINVTIRADDKVKIRSHSSPYMTGGYYGRPGGASYGSSVGVGVAVGGRSSMKSEASVFIDFVDFKEHRVVWQGVAVIEVNDKVAQQLRNAIFTATNKLLAEYPHTAGQR